MRFQLVLRPELHARNSPPEPDSTFLAYGGASITTSMLYDGNSRVRQLVDDKGSITLWTYDSLNRQTVMTFHDGSTRVNDYDEASDVIEYTDENGSVFTNTFDAKGRKTAVSISLASGVVGTTSQSFQYDGLSRTTFARDTVSATNADVTMVYDSLSRVLEDSQAFGGNTRNVTSEKFTSYPMTQFAFPNGRQITNTYDDLYRRTLVEETSGGADIAAWEFFGSDRVAECVLGNGLIMSFMNNARTRSAMQEDLASPIWGNQSSDRLGYDGAGRIITKRFLAGGINGGTGAYNNSSSLVGQTTVFDMGSNKLYERELHADSRSHLYEPFDDQTPLGGYDSLDRLRQYQRGVLSTTGGQGNAGGGWVTTPISLPGTDEARTYDLDGLGNWHHTVFTPVGGSETDELRQHNGLNQITTINDGGGNVPFNYDGVTGASNGNLTDDGIRTYKWDALNRLKEVRKKAGDVLIGQYDYDAMNRRIRKEIFNGGLSGTITNGTTDFTYNTDWQSVEERNGSNEPVKQYIWGVYIDELLQQTTFVTINGNAAGDYYPLQDLLYRTTALTDDSGNVVEAYDTDAYGNTLLFTSPGTASNWFADDATEGDTPTCDFIFTGRMLDVESALYNYRRRYYETISGRFLSRDPLGFRGRVANLYEYVRSMSTRMIDPFGLEECTTVGSSRNVTLSSYILTPALRGRNPNSAEAMEASAESMKALLKAVKKVPGGQIAGKTLGKVYKESIDAVLDASKRVRERFKQDGVAIWVKLDAECCEERRRFANWFQLCKEWFPKSTEWLECESEFGAGREPVSGYAEDDADGIADGLKRCSERKIADFKCPEN